jgi:hypothetical protein
MFKEADRGASDGTSTPSPKFTQSTSLRKASSVVMILLLYTTATPFGPMSWLLGEIEGSFLLDRFLAGVLLFSALYFQWRIAKAEFPVVISLPTGNSRQFVSNGRMTQERSEIAWLYRPEEYWKYVGIEAGLLVVAEFGKVEIIRKGVVTVVIACLWGVGWTVTPKSVKVKAWEYVKMIWFYIALDEIMGIGGRRGHRRRW